MTLLIIGLALWILAHWFKRLAPNLRASLGDPGKGIVAVLLLAGLVLMIIVLESVGLNPAWIALIFPIDRILDMCRTVVNVTGDGAVSSFIAASEGELTPPSA